MMKTNITTLNKPPITRVLFLFVIIFFCTNRLDANIDSLRQIWTNVTQADSTRFNAINEYYSNKIFSQPDSVLLLTAYHIELAQQKHSEKQKSKAISRKAMAYMLKGDNDKAVLELNKAIDIFSSLKDSINLINQYNNLATIYTNQIKYQEALHYFSKCLAFYRENKIEDIQAAVLFNIGQIHLDIKNHDLALDYFNRSLQLYKKLDIEDHIGVLRINIGRVNLGKKNYHQALEDIQKALKLFQRANKQYYIANAYTLNAVIYQELNQIDTALVYIKKGLELHQAIDNNLLVLKDKIVLGNLTFPKDVNKATQIGEEVLKKAGEYRDHTMKMELYNLLYRCYQKKRNYPLSLSMLEKYNAYSDSLIIEQDQVAITTKLTQDEYEAKIISTEIKNEQVQSELKLIQFKKAYTILSLGSAIILAFVFYYKSKKITLNKDKEVLLDKIAHLKEMENTHHQLIQSDKMASLGQLTAGVAHEINNPINFISSGVVGLKKTLNEYIESPKDESKKELVKDMNDMITAIEDGAHRTNTIVKSLRLFSREDTDNYIEADVIKLLESTLALLSNQIKGKALLEKYYESKEVPIFCFPGQLNQVFMHVVMNAIQAVEGTGTIKVKIKEQEKSVTITISDNGPGIPDDTKQKIFEPFYTTKNIQEGTGLGLSISFGIIKKHNGSIEVIDNEPKGTTFVINLPKKEDSLIP